MLINCSVPSSLKCQYKSDLILESILSLCHEPINNSLTLLDPFPVFSSAAHGVLPKTNIINKPDKTKILSFFFIT